MRGTGRVAVDGESESALNARCRHRQVVRTTPTNEEDVAMETWDPVRARRNVRQYADEPIARADLDRILDAGRRAPSAGNWQPWDFVVVTDRARLVELSKVWARGGRHMTRSAPHIALGPPRAENT